VAWKDLGVSRWRWYWWRIAGRLERLRPRRRVVLPRRRGEAGVLGLEPLELAEERAELE